MPGTDSATNAGCLPTDILGLPVGHWRPDAAFAMVAATEIGTGHDLDMEIENAVAHRLIKPRNARGAEVRPADAELDRTDELNELLTAVLDSYNNRSSRFSGSFEPDEENYRFSVSMRAMLAGESNFLAFSLTALERLRLKIEDVVFASGGYLLLVRYTHQQRDFLLVAKLNAQTGSIFSEDLHRVIRSDHLNLDRLQVAARVDLGAWRAGADRYLSFVLKRDKDNGPSDYFQDFIGCRVDQDSKVESRKLVQVVKDFSHHMAETGALPAEQVPDVQQRAYDYVEAVRRGETPRLEAFDLLANAMWPDEPDTFLRFLNGHADPPSAGFVPDRTTLKRLSNIDFKSREISVKMTYAYKQQHVRIEGSRVVIENAPDRLIQELTEG